MTVAELIEKLQEMPLDAQVRFECSCCGHYVQEVRFGKFESSDGTGVELSE